MLLQHPQALEVQLDGIKEEVEGHHKEMAKVRIHSASEYGVYDAGSILQSPHMAQDLNVNQQLQCMCLVLMHIGQLSCFLMVNASVSCAVPSLSWQLLQCMQHKRAGYLLPHTTCTQHPAGAR